MVLGMLFLDNFIVDTTFPVVPGNTAALDGSRHVISGQFHCGHHFSLLSLEIQSYLLPVNES